MEQYVRLTQNKTAVVMVMVMKTVWLTDVIFTVYYHIRRVQYIRLCTDKDKEQTNNGTSGKQNRWLKEWTKDWTYIQTELMRCRWSEEENHRWAEKHKNHKKHKKTETTGGMTDITLWRTVNMICSFKESPGSKVHCFQVTFDLTRSQNIHIQDISPAQWWK